MLDIRLNGCATRSLTLADSPKLAWFFLVGDQDFEYEGRNIAMSEEFDEVSAAVIKQLDTGFKPSLITEHTPAGFTLGQGERGRVLTKAEAKSLGIDQVQPRALYAGWSLNSAGREKYDSGEIEYTSIGLSLGWTDPETGVVWPALLKELSAVGIPHLKTQVPASALRGLELNDREGLMATKEKPAAAGEDIAAMDGDGVSREDFDALAAKVDALVEAVANMTAMDEPKEDDEEVAASDVPSKIELRLTDRLKKLEGEIKLRDAQAEVEKALAGKTYEPEDEKLLLELSADGHKAAFKRVVALLPAAPAHVHTRSATRPGQALDLSEQSAVDAAVRARMAADPNLTYRTALSAVTASVRG